MALKMVFVYLLQTYPVLKAYMGVPCRYGCQFIISLLELVHRSMNTPRDAA